MIGQTISHYRIIRRIGAGGMGEVYCATDTKLGRDVALKILPPDVAADPERLERFRREARALAAINHPHIVTIYSVEEADGVHFLTMELIEGQSLDHCIPEGGLPIERLGKIAIVLADALAAAHEKGIVHRDLKPANVMLTSSGQVKVLDFGLAKEMRASGTDDTTLTSAGHTEVGVVMGTPSYMSPEQIAGRPVDHRTDIFSLGVILYEMSIAQRPFKGASSAELTSAILRDTPPLVTDIRASLPAALARIIRRCLEKSTADRFPSARDLCNELGNMPSTAPTIQTPSSSLSRPSTAPDSGAARTDEGFWVAVLPFKFGSGNADLTTLAEGLAEDIVTGLSRFSYLRVIARSSTSKFAGESADVRAIGSELGARYVMEGSIRQAGTRLRIAAQLVDATTGAHLWAETFDSPFRAESVFELQDDIVPRIVSTVADLNGILPYTMGESLRGRAADELTPYEALLRSFSYYARLTADEHAAACAGLERAVQQSPDHADCWAMLAILYTDEHKTGFNVRPDPLKRALNAARRAVELAPSSHLAHHALASVFYFRKELQAFRSTAERAIALNPMDGCTAAYMGILMAYSGEWERGCALAERAMQLNSHHPGWYWFASSFGAYRKSDYRSALDISLKVNMRGLWGASLLLAAAYAQLGEHDAAREAANQLLALIPNFAAVGRAEMAKWWDVQLVEHLLDGLRKAGMDIADEMKTGGLAPAARPAGVHPPSGLSLRPAIAVLPFHNISDDPEQEYFADGITEEIINSLAHIPRLRVAGRSSSFSFKGRNEDLRSVGAKLGVNTILEGTLRRSGNRLRITAQLIDASSGYQLWSERYDRVMEDVFALQDEIARTIAERLRLSLAAARDGQHAQPPTKDIAAYELYVKGRYYWNKRTPADIKAAIAFFNQAIDKDPGYALAYAGLADAYFFLSPYGGVPNDFVAKSNAAAERALELDPTLARPHAVLGYNKIAYKYDFSGGEAEFRMALELDSRDATTHQWLAENLSYMGGRGQEAIDEANLAYELDPLSPILSTALAEAYYFDRQFDKAIEACNKVIADDPTFGTAHAWLATSYWAEHKYPQAIQEWKTAAQLGGEKSYVEYAAGLDAGFRAGGWPNAVRKGIEIRLAQRKAKSGYVSSARIAQLYADSGEKDHAFEWLDTAYKERDFWLITLRSDARFDALRSDPRYAELVHKIGFSQ